MKYLYNKIIMISLIMMTITTANAEDIFSHTVLTLPDNPGNEQPWSQVISSQEEWETFFYAQTAHITYPQGEAPVAEKFDFEKFQVLAGGLGLKTSGGYSLVVEKVIELDNVINIQVLDIKPGKNCVVFTQITYPSATVLVKKTNKPFRFTVIAITYDCPLT